MVLSRLPVLGLALLLASCQSAPDQHDEDVQSLRREFEELRALNKQRARECFRCGFVLAALLTPGKTPDDLRILAQTCARACDAYEPGLFSFPMVEEK
jgi:hypothetical protein